MTDFPYVGPPAGGLELAMATARGRRLRKAGFSSGLTAFTLASVALLAGTSGRVTLVQQPPPEIPAVTSVERVPAGEAESRTANTLQPGSLAAFAGHPNRSTTSSADTTSPRAQTPGLADADGDDSHGAAAVPYRSAAMKRDDGNSLYLPTDYQCAVKNDGTARTSPLCPNAYVGPASTTNGTRTYSLQSSVCSSDTRTTVLHYATSREVDLVIYKGNRAVWRWSATQQPARNVAHTLSLDTGSCYTWTTDWTGVDGSGHSLAKADDYRMVATFTAAEVADFSTYETTFSIS